MGRETLKKENAMSKLIVKFDTHAISTDVDPSRSYTLQLLDRPVYDDSLVFREVVKEKTLPFDEDMLKFAFLSVLKTMTQKVAADCVPRKIGNYLKFLPTIRGKVKGPYSPYNPQTCSTAIVVQSLSGLEKTVNTTALPRLLPASSARPFPRLRLTKAQQPSPIITATASAIAVSGNTTVLAALPYEPRSLAFAMKI